MAESRITRHFANVTDGRWGARQVHYRRVGKGPVVICLHQSPLSSRDMISTMERWQEHFTCIAPDTPGFGLSDPLGVATAETADFADALVEFMDAIGVEKAAIYGFHTGAMVTCAIAEHHPSRVTCALANGYVLLTERARKDILDNYLPPFEPKWDGSHLTWLWARMREQLIFFPWYSKAQADRMQYSVPSPENLQAGCVEFMRSGDHYRVGYRAAFSMRSDLALTRIRVPTLVTATETDVLARDLARIQRKTDAVTVTAGGDMPQTLDLCRDFILKHLPPLAPEVVPPAPLPCRMWQDYVDVPGGQLRIRRNHDAKSGRPVLIQHDAAGSSEIVHELARGFIGHRPVIAINLPGHGESDNTLKGKVTVTAYARVVEQALKTLGIEEYDFVGTWGGGLVGLELALRDPKSVRHLVMADTLWFDDKLRRELREHYTPDIRPNWYGGQLLEAWHMLRDQGLFWPWFRRTREGIINQPTHVDPVMIQARVLELFRSEGMWREAYQAHFAYPLQKRMAQVDVPVHFVAPGWDPQLEATKLAARESRKGRFEKMPDRMFDWAERLMPFLDR
jgi:pimeloyl-ACP methyl ester carboxylesterase